MLAGIYDGTTPAAVMVDSTSGQAFGPIFDGHDAYEQIQAFEDWLRREPFRDDAIYDAVGLEPSDLPTPTVVGDDPRHWPEPGLRKLVAYFVREDLISQGGTHE